jgi:putative ABC transport system permease protein
MFFLNFKIALRNLQRNKGFSFINIGGLAIGLTCCLLLLLYVNFEWSYDKNFKNLDRIYVVKLNHTIDGGITTANWTPNKVAPAALQTLPALEAAARVSFNGFNMLFSYGNTKFRINALSADPSFLTIFDYQVLRGNLAIALNQPNNLILTESTAKRLFGKEDPIGKSLKWDNRALLKVTAIIKDLPKNQSLQFDAINTWSFYENVIATREKGFGWGAISCLSFVKLKENASFTATDLAMRKLIVANNPESQLEAFLYPLSRHYLYDDFKNGKQVGGRIDQVKLFAFLAFCVLLIASINYMNLSTARSEKRAREVGVRKALGSTRQLLMGQFLLESLLLSFIAMLVSFALLEISLPYFNHLLDTGITIDYGSYLFWGVLLGLVLLTGLLAGSYPAFYLSSFIPVKVLKGFKVSGSGSLSIRKTLVIVQFSLSICMIICAIVIYTQMQFMKNKPLGFASNNLVQLQLQSNFKTETQLNLLKQELKKSGAVLSATEYAGGFTNMSNNTSDLRWPGKAEKETALFEYRSVGYDFAKTIGTKVVTGRDFSPKYLADTSTNVLLNEAAVKRMSLKNPVGTIIRWEDSPPLTIIGVLKDYSNDDLGSGALPTLYYYNVGLTYVMLLRLNPKQSLATSMATIKTISERLNPAYPPEITFVDEAMADKLADERLLSVLSNLFGGFCIFISCLGLLGLALYMAEQRKKEISIRKVLGADLTGILILLNRDFLKLVVIANVIAFPVAYLVAGKWLQHYDYRIDMGIGPFLSAGFLSLLIALFTVSLQSFKVAKANPVDALKYE